MDLQTPKACLPFCNILYRIPKEVLQDPIFPTAGSQQCQTSQGNLPAATVSFSNISPGGFKADFMGECKQQAKDKNKYAPKNTLNWSGPFSEIFELEPESSEKQVLVFLGAGWCWMVRGPPKTLRVLPRLLGRVFVSKKHLPPGNLGFLRLQRPLKNIRNSNNNFKSQPASQPGPGLRGSGDFVLTTIY